MTFARPKLVVSKCLGFAACRYDGAILHDHWLSRLAPFVDFVQVCPEEAIGLGTPRDPVRIVRRNGMDHLVQPSTEREVTREMHEFSESFLEGVASSNPPDAFVLKNRSPSCAISDTKIYSNSPGPNARGPGLFGGAVLQRFDDLPIIDEGRLKNFTLREHFLTTIFTMAEWRTVRASGSMHALTQFHASRKLLLYGHSQSGLRKLGRVAANADNRPFEQLASDYEAMLRAAFKKPAGVGSNVNALQHALGYFRDRLTTGEKAHYLNLLDRYKAGTLPLSSPVSVMNSFIVRFDEPYLKKQAFFRPFPEDLVEITDSGKGRNR